MLLLHSAIVLQKIITIVHYYVLINVCLLSIHMGTLYLLVQLFDSFFNHCWPKISLQIGYVGQVIAFEIEMFNQVLQVMDTPGHDSDMYCIICCVCLALITDYIYPKNFA